MKTATLILLLALPLCAAAQGRGRPQEPDSLSLGALFSGRSGFDARSASFSSAFSLGLAGGYALSGSGEAVHHRIWTAGPFPGELYDTSLGLRASGKKWNFGAGARSNSDRPFNSLSETDLSLDASTTLRRRGPHTLLLGFSYSSRRSFLRGVPFPYLSYSYNTERLNLFFPFGLKWRPRQGGEFSAAYFPPRYFTLGYKQKFSEVLTLGLQGGLQMSQYLLAGRPDKDYALFLEQPHAGLRTEVTPAKGWGVALWTGWGFKGRYYSGKQYDDYHAKTAVGAGPIAGLNLRKLF
jgi:hypothetical protein